MTVSCWHITNLGLRTRAASISLERKQYNIPGFFIREHAKQALIMARPADHCGALCSPAMFETDPCGGIDRAGVEHQSEVEN